MTTAIHPTRLRILAEVMRANQEGRPSPTIRELAKASGIAIHAVQQHLDRLRRDGLISWKNGLARTLRATCRVVIT